LIPKPRIQHGRPLKTRRLALRIIISTIACCCQLGFGQVGAFDNAESWVPIPATSGTELRINHVSVWTGQEMIVWGGSAGRLLGDGARYSPGAHRWITMSNAGRPSPRSVAMAAWTGEELLVWGGAGTDGLFNDGARYNPATDSWLPISMVGAPSPRWDATAAWTGSELLVWGGSGVSGEKLGDGARYDPRADTWTPMTRSGAPAARTMFAWVWTGSELLVWGGQGNLPQRVTVGAAYNPATDSWRTIASSDAPRFVSAVWTGSRMIVWNGQDGSAYDPIADAWTAISTDTGVRSRAKDSNRAVSLVWTGREMVTWGGSVGVRPILYLRDGSRYDPTTDTWSPIPEDGPAAGDRQTAIWTGEEMLVWPGGDASGTGGAYRPYWLAVVTTTQVYGIDDAPLFLGMPGERYRVVKLQGDWALVQKERDPPSLQEWIRIDERVQLLTPFPS
jgi:hypothetical protein